MGLVCEGGLGAGASMLRLSPPALTIGRIERFLQMITEIPSTL